MKATYYVKNVFCIRSRRCWSFARKGYQTTAPNSKRGLASEEYNARRQRADLKPLALRLMNP